MKKSLLTLSLFVITALLFSACSSDTVEPAVEAPSNLVYSPSSLTLTEGSTGTSATPTISGEAPITFALVNAVSGVSINTTTGVINVASTLSAGNYNITVKATNAGGDRTFSSVYSIQVNAPNTAPSTLSYSSSSVTLRKHETQTLTATSNGTPPLSYLYLIHI